MKPFAIGGVTLVVVALVVLVLLWRGAPRLPDPPPAGRFRLSVVKDTRTPRSWNIELRAVTRRPHDDNSGTGVPVQWNDATGTAASSAMPGIDIRTCEATVGFSADIVQSRGSTRLRTTSHITTPSSQSAGAADNEISAQSLTAIGQFSATPGDYPLGVPLVLGRLNGKPIRLVFGHR